MTPPLTVAPSPAETLAAQYEQENVHEVYNLIATHFSATRYKPWPSITRFLHSLPPGSLGVDAGCGNGKYLPAWDAEEARAKGCFMIGLDRSDKLLELARRCGYEPGQPGVREAVVGDVLDLGGVRKGSMDFAISIATLHHISLPARRLFTMRTFLRALAPTHGRGMIYVWALEQSKDSRRHAPGEDLEKGTGEQDVFVPWVLSKEAPKTTQEALAGIKREKVRRPQKAKKGSATNGPTDAIGESSQTIAKPRDNVEEASTIPEVDAIMEKLAGLPVNAANSEAQTPPRPATPPKVYQRYYHLFRGSELVDLVAAASEAEGLLFLPLAPAEEPPEARSAREERGIKERQGREWVRVDEYFWEKDNWVCILQRGYS